MRISSSSRLEVELRRAAEFYQQGKLREAEAICSEILKQSPYNLPAIYLLGEISLDLHRTKMAVELFERTIAINGRVSAFHNNLGRALYDLKQLERAIASYDKAIELDRGHANAYFNRGIALRVMGRLEDAVASYDMVLKFNPDDAEAYNNRGIALEELHQLDEALISYNKAISKMRNFAGAYYNRGNVLSQLDSLEQALHSYDCAIRIQPDYAEAHCHRGIALGQLKRFEESLRSHERAIQLKPNYAEAYFGRGNALAELKRFGHVLDSYDRAIRIQPDYAEAHCHRGIALGQLKRFEESLRSHERAIQFKPDYAKAYANRGVALGKLRRFEEALQNYKRAFELQPDGDFFMGNYLHARMQICDWSDYPSSVADLHERLFRDEKIAAPFHVVVLSNSLELQRKASGVLIGVEYPANAVLGPLLGQYVHKKIRIGYFSSDFHNHATAFLIVGLLERHDRSRFELTAFSLGPDTDDDMRRRVRAAFDAFIDVRGKSDRDVALLARSLEIDIAIDLDGFTEGERTNIFALRAAPIQVNYLGYPGTMGADYIDYLIADQTLIPASHQPYYSEKIAYLPHSYQPNDRERRISDRVFTRTEVGLPPQGFVFCCFNNNYKITPDVFASWMRILRRVEGSVLWLLADNELAARNLKNAAAGAGIDAARLVFAPRMALPEHLARHRLADLFLDTLPCNAHTTASDALWAGLPVLTQIGETFAGRVAASLLNAVGLPELVTTTQDAYEALAIKLATDPGALDAIRRKLVEQRLSAPLFDTELFARHIEAAYTMMHERYRADLPPDHLSIPQ